MDQKYNDLWQGGPWEQPAPVVTPIPTITIPSGAASSRRPVLRTRRRRRRWLRVLLVLLLLALLTGLAAFLDRNVKINLELPWPATPPTQDELHVEEPKEFVMPSIPKAETGTGVTLDLLSEGEQALSYTQIYEKCLPSMVSLEVQSDGLYSTGTGIIFTSDGYIVTNAHVVSGAKSVDVLFADNQILPAKLVGFAPNDDLAVLKVEATGLTPADFGDSSLLQCGDPVAALGDSLGYRATFTDGIVSALDRELDVDGTTMMLIQTSAAINYGNSGGALLNQYGQVVGVTTIKIVSHDGSAEAMGFAIPSQRVKYVVDALIAGKVIRTAAFGITVSTFPVAEGGLEVIDVAPNSDAWAKGLRSGDRLITLEGKPITSSSDLARAKQYLGPGDTVSFTYIRDGVEAPITVALMASDDVQY